MRSDAESFDLVVLGTGAAGSAAAGRCRAAGWRVSIIDDLPYGGTCTLRGCDPKRVLVGAAELVDWRRRMAGAGIVGDARIDWPALMRFKRSFTDPVPAQQEIAFQNAGIVTYHGVARFTSEDRLVIGNRELQATHFVIATGAEPRRLGVPGEEHVRTSTDFLDLDELPRRIVLIGAGYIAFEFSHLARRAGAEVVMLGRSQALASFDQDLVQRLVAHTRTLGVDVRLNAAATSVEVCDGTYRVRARGTDDAVVDADLVVHAAGRVPKTRALEPETAHVRLDARGAVVVNEYLQSVSNPRVYAAGDATLPPGKLPLTPVAAHEGLVIASNLLHGNRTTPDYRGTPSVVFTVPPLARAGLTEAEARRQQLPVRVNMEETGTWFSQRRVRETTASFKTIVEEGTGRLLGAHLLGPHADEVINVFALAVRHQLTASDLSHMIYAYPTNASDVPYMV
ncbi:MAG TPA: NAD(P)/FAD-dependent oxidoreductase [Gemmatimonadaceae bacterium]|jgi:glutathione reductase (NADPH)|nr:NAD(P)/FAD-dependent oxidoreductase [Gemmatimonadaceae bacterium]